MYFQTILSAILLPILIPTTLAYSPPSDQSSDQPSYNSYGNLGTILQDHGQWKVKAGDIGGHQKRAYPDTTSNSLWIEMNLEPCMVFYYCDVANPGNLQGSLWVEQAWRNISGLIVEQTRDNLCNDWTNPNPSAQDKISLQTGATVWAIQADCSADPAPPSDVTPF